MQELIVELRRLYLLDGQLCFEGGERDAPLPLTAGLLEQHLLGVRTVALALQSPAGSGRAIVLDFAAGGPARGEQQWRALCETANALRERYQLPAPAVSISGHGFQLWLSLREPQPAGRIAEFARLLQRACLPDPLKLDAANGELVTVVELPPGRQANGKWSAFIHPGMGASFADDPALEMAPPISAQLGFLEGLQSIAPAAFEGALAQLRGEQGVGAADPVAPPAGTVGSVLLHEASLEQIVAELHRRQIEPTFRHVLPASPR